MRFLCVAAAAACLALSGCSSSEPAKEAAVRSFKAPDVFKIKLDTSKGPVVIEIHRDWAPIGADHLYDLVKHGYYDGARFFRVLPGFMAQFGIAADPAVSKKWADARIPDDPVTQHNTAGMLTYAKTNEPNSRSTQLFINMADNSRLDAQGFSPLGTVISGMDAVMSFYSGYGEGAPSGAGPDQQTITDQGNVYLQGHFPLLDFIKTATVE
ncbi:MAG: peptidylprolyl isomerase [Bryobacteraceae bacterium]